MREAGSELGNRREGSLAPRADFPALEEVAYLNTASFGLPAEPVRREARAFDEEIARRGTVGFDDSAEAAVYDGARAAVADLLNGESLGVAIVGSVTEAIAQLAWGLRPRREENVVSTDIEFPSVTYPWLRAAEEFGFEVRLVDALRDPANLCLDHVAELVDERTAIICISHVQYGTGARLDPARLAALAHEHDALLILDAYQSAGVVPLDVAAADIDILVGGSMKWLCGVPGAGFCYIRPELLGRFRPAIVGWRSPEDPSNFDARTIRLAAGARRMEFATMAYGAGIGLAAAIRYVDLLGVDRVLEHDLRLGSRLIDGLDALGAHVQTPRAPESRAGIVNARFARRDNARIAATLNERGVIVSPRLGGTRFSLHMFNTEEDVDRALIAIDEVLYDVGALA